MEEKKTSADWQKQYPDPVVLDPDGWDRKFFKYSWYEELITYSEYKRRMFMSTCLFERNTPHNLEII